MATETVNVTGTIANDAVTNAKLANMAAGTHKGRAIGAGTGDPQDLTPDQSSAILDTATDPLMRTSDAVAAFDPLTQNRPNNTTPDLSFHYFPVYDPGDAQSEKTDGVEIKAWLAGEFDALGAAAAALVSANAHSDALVVGLFDDRGNWDASGNLWPATGGSGTAGAVLKGDVWRVSVAGTLGGELADVGDSFRALVDTPGQTASNWALFAANTQQATESVRGTAAIATQAEAEDSASTNDIDIVTPKKWWQAFVAGLNTTRLGSVIHAATDKATPVDADELPLVDSAASNVLKKLTWANLKATLFTTIGLAYARLTNPSAVTFPRQNADNTVTSRTAEELRSDLGVSRELASITSNFTTSSGTYVDITGLAVTLEANSVYQVTMLTPYQSPALATGAGVSITMTGSPTLRNASRTMFTTGSVAGTTTSNTDDNHNINTTISPANATLGCVMIMSVMTSGSACTIQGRAARGGTAGTITIMAGSSISALKIS